MTTAKYRPILAATLVLLSFLSLRCERYSSPAPAPAPAASTSPTTPGVSVTPTPVSPTPVTPITAPPDTITRILPPDATNPNAVQVWPLTPEIPQPATPAQQTALQDDARRAHEEGGRIAVASIKSLLASQDFDNAQRLAASAARDYADTTSAPEFAPLLQQAQAAAQSRASAVTNPNNNRHAQFLAARDAGITAMNRQDYPAAITQFQAALQQEDDPETRAMLQHASNFVGKPRIAVAEFAVVGDVGIPDAGKAVPELMLGRFDPQRFQLVERAWLDSLLAQQGLTLAQVADMPELLRVRRVDAIRYLVVGTVSRLGALTVSARLVDVATGQVVQTADAVANDPVGLQNCLTELTAILQMSNEEKANYLAFRQRQSDALAAVDPAARAAAEAQRQADLEAQRRQNAQQQAAAFAQAQHERDAAVALADIKALFSQSNFADAINYIHWARPRFNDTSAAQELAAMDAYAQNRYQDQIAQQQNAAAWAQAQAALAARHQRFVQYRDQGLAALAANDLLSAMSLLQTALNEEDNPDVRGTLDWVVRRMARPGIVVLDFDVRGDVGMNPREAPHWLAAGLAQQFDGDNSPYRVIDRPEFLADLRRVGLTLGDVQRDPLQPRMRLLRDQIRYIIVGTATHGSINLNTSMIDLAAGRTVQTAEFIAENVRALPDALAGTALVLQMTDDQKRAYIDQLEYANWMARGDAAAQAQQWDAALDAYTRACRISNTPDALDHMTFAGTQQENARQARRAYDTAMAAADQSARFNNWDQALDLYRQAWSILPTPEAKAGFDNARARLIADARDRHALYLSSMASGDTFSQNGDWDRALDAYSQAYQVEASQEASTAVARAQRAISDRQQARDRAYASAMNEAKNAIQNGNWQRALDAYTRAAAVNNTRETAAGIATARRKLAESEANAKLYAAAMQDARTAAQANNWADALMAHKRAAIIMDTAEVQAAIAQDKKQIALIQQRDKNVLYNTAMGKAAASAAAGNWQDALEAYRSAYELQKTKPASDGIAQATKMLSDAAYNRKQYDKAMADAAAAGQAGTWARALIAYQQAQAIDPTPEAKAGVARAQQQIWNAAAADKKKQYTQLMTEGDAAARTGDLKKALGSYTRAAAVDNTPEVQTALTATQKKIADAQAAEAALGAQKKQYALFLANGDAAAKAGDWQKALDAYTRAATFDNTPAVQANIANAKTKLAANAASTAAAADRQKQYTTLMTDAAAAAKAGDGPRALDAYTRAAAINNTPQAQAGITAAKKQIADAAAATAAAGKKKQYDTFMADAAAAGKAGQWQLALDTYTKAAAVDNTAEVKAAITNARQQLALTAATDARKRQYAQAVADGDAAAKAGTWQKALDAYTKAASFDNTPDVQTAIANAKAKLAEAATAADRKKQYDAAMTQGEAAARSGDWQKALDAYTKAASFDETPQVQAAIANAQKQLAAGAAAAADKKKQYDAFVTDAAAAGKAGDWQKAIDDYNKAAAIDNTPELRAAITYARAQIAAADAKKKQYTQLMSDGADAAKAGTWQKALDAYTKAAALDNTPEAQAGIANAKAKLAAPPALTPAANAAQQKRLHDQAVTDGDAAAKTNDWQTAFDSYTRAQAIDATPAVQTKLTNAKQKLYAKYVADAETAFKAGKWQEAVDAYTKAAAVDNTPGVQAALANAKKKLAGN